MGGCVARLCWPSYPDPRYIPVRSRYLREDETVQDQPRRRLSTLTSSTSSSDVSLCMSDIELLVGDPAEGGILNPTPHHHRHRSEEDDLPLSLSPGPAQSSGLLAGSPLSTPDLSTRSTRNPAVSLHCTPQSTPLTLAGSAYCMPNLADSATSTPLLLSSSPPSPLLVGNLPACHAQYYNLTTQADDELILASNNDHEEEDEEKEEQYEDSPLPFRRTNRVVTIGVTGKRWGIRGTPGSSLPSLTEPDSPPTASIDLEWEPEAGLVRMSRESLDEEASHTAESNSWVPRSSCSTPNSLEWDFRASTLSLRGNSEDEPWQNTDMETEQLIHEIEQLTARALADTGHGLHAAPR